MHTGIRCSRKQVQHNSWKSWNLLNLYFFCCSRTLTARRISPAPKNQIAKKLQKKKNKTGASRMHLQYQPVVYNNKGSESISKGPDRRLCKGDPSWSCSKPLRYTSERLQSATYLACLLIFPKFYELPTVGGKIT